MNGHTHCLLPHLALVNVARRLVVVREWYKVAGKGEECGRMQFLMHRNTGFCLFWINDDGKVNLLKNACQIFLNLFLYYQTNIFLLSVKQQIPDWSNHTAGHCVDVEAWELSLNVLRIGRLSDQCQFSIGMDLRIQINIQFNNSHNFTRSSVSLTFMARSWRSINAAFLRKT